MVQQERVEVNASLQHAASFHCLVEEWKDCEKLKPKSKEMWIFVNKKGKDASDGVVCDTEEVSVYEMRKEQQKHEDAWKMWRTKVVGGRLKTPIGKLVKITFWRTRHG